jgi:uncharacterized DUF497 family protein
MVNLDIEFEWDLLKEAENYKKHQCSFVEAIESFGDVHGIQVFDAMHSMLEQRFYWIGKTSTGRIITTWFTRRGSKVRIIGSAELRKFRRLYETSKIE